MEETWKELVYPPLDARYNHYEISSLGRLKNTKTGRVLKQNLTRSGYLTVRVCTKDRNTKMHIIIHRAVAYTFLENPHGYLEVNHIDSDRTNNCVSNLEWCTSHHNQQHKYDSGSFDIRKISGENNHNAKLTWEDVKFIRKSYKKYSKTNGAAAISRLLGVSKPVVLRVVHSEGWVNEQA